MLNEFVMNGMIDMEMFLSHSNLPFSQALLEDLRNRKEQMQGGGMTPQEAVSGLSQNFNQMANPDQGNLNKAMNMMNPRINKAA